MKSIVIIGASSGIGHHCARTFIANNWKVAVVARRIELLEPLKELSPSTVTCYKLDITSDDAAASLNDIINEQGNVDVILHVAGIGKQNRDLKPSIEESTIKTNALGFARIVDAAFNYFKSHTNGGHIAVVSSIAGTKGLGSAPSYSATKRFQNTYIDALDQLSRMNHHCVKFTDIRPGFVDTDLLDNSHHYPMMLTPQLVAQRIFKAITRQERVVVIDWRYSLLTFFWSLIPRWIWVRLPIKN